MKIILISGKQGSGKTTLADSIALALSKRHGYFVHRLKFAGTLYEMHDAVLRILKSKGVVHEKKKDGELLQLLGTEWGRKCLGSDIWADCLKGEVKKASEGYTEKAKVVAIVDDCRFENEFDAFPDALKVRLEADEKVRMKRCEYWRENTEHPSETGLDAYAAAGKFDLTYSTHVSWATPEGLASLIIKKLWKLEEENNG